MNMKNEEKIYQLNTYNIAEYTSTDYTDNDIAILGDFKNLLFNKYFKLNANIYVVCVKGRLQININTPKYAIYPGEMLICMYNPQIEMFAHFKTKSSFHKTKRII